MSNPNATHRARCRKCGDTIESTHNRDMRWCSCRAIYVDGGPRMPRTGGNPEDIETA